MPSNLALAASDEAPKIVVDATQPARLYPRIREQLARLASEVDAAKRSAGFTKVLDTMSVFWEYSPFNQWLIRMQMRNAKRVAGQRAWEQVGRKLIPESRPILIFAPAKLTPPFIPVAIYDISQTRGRRLPSLDIALHGATDVAAGLERTVAKLGICLKRFDGSPGHFGHSCGGTIYIRRRLSGQERAATIAHELAHEILHDMRSRGERSPRQEETEAEATSYVVMRALGLPSKAPAYIAWQGGDGKLVLQSLKRVQRAARRILEAYGHLNS